MSPFESINSSPEPQKGESPKDNIQTLLSTLPKAKREEVMERMVSDKEDIRDYTRASLLQLKSQIDKWIDAVSSVMNSSPIKINYSVKHVEWSENWNKEIWYNTLGNNPNQGEETEYASLGNNQNQDADTGYASMVNNQNQDADTGYASMINNPNQGEETGYASLEDGEIKSMWNNPNDLNDDDAEYAKMIRDPNFENWDWKQEEFFSIRNATPEELASMEQKWNQEEENQPQDITKDNSSMASNESNIPVNAKVDKWAKNKKEQTKPNKQEKTPDKEVTQRTSRNPKGQEELKPINSKVAKPKKEPTEAVKQAESQENIQIPELAKINLQDELKRINDWIKELNWGLAKIAFSKENRENAIKNVEDWKTIIKAIATMQEEVERWIREWRKPKELVAIINAHNEIINDYRRLWESIKAKGNKEAVAYLAKNDYKTMATDFSRKILDMDSKLKAQWIEFGSSKNYISSLASTLTAWEDPKFISERISSLWKRA